MKHRSMMGINASVKALSFYHTQELTQLLWSFATSGHCPDTRWLRVCYSELAIRRSELKHKELCGALWALAKLKLDPGVCVLRVLINS